MCQGGARLITPLINRPQIVLYVACHDSRLGNLCHLTVMHLSDGYPYDQLHSCTTMEKNLELLHGELGLY